MRKTVVAVAMTVVATSAVGLLGAPAGGAVPSPEARPGVAKPNVVLVVMDDMRLDDAEWMPRTVRRVAGAGATYDNFYTPMSLCCPARASLLRGQYPHNTGIVTNAEPDGG